MSQVQIVIESGPHRGDTLSLPLGSCRLIGRHLTEGETSLTDGPDLRHIDTDLHRLAERHRQQFQPQSAASPQLTRGPDIILADEAVSRAHAMLFYDQNYLGIIDLGSTNGTYLNNAPCSEATLQDGDRLLVGESCLVIHLQTP